MRTINYNGKVGRAIFAFSLMLGIGFMMSITTQAQYRNDDQWQRRERDRIIWQDRIRARREAQRNAQRSDRYDRNTVYGNNGGYNNGGYNNGGYNNGGYNNGGYNNGGYNNGGYNNGNQMALNQGYQAGIQTGASDAQRGQNYSPQRSHYFRNANSQAFRNGFVRGYDAGFRQYSGYNNGGYNNGGYRTNNGGGIVNILGGILGRP